ncbi:MAG: DUF4623 domain-containing protein [Phycisphaerae bacterium]|nr:DUF4623 domain-containing protein [Phycisphaerae bacterium]MDW8261709.1 DUF4623 domain-containing protein [Phycisphaerales bacterium]
MRLSPLAFAAALGLGSATFAAPGLFLNPLFSFGGDGVLSPGEIAALTTDNNQRGIAYNAITNRVYLVNRAGGLSIRILDGDTGAEVGTLNTSGITGGTFVLSTIAVGDDGAIYGANLTTNTSSSALKIYRWADESAVPTVAFNGSPTNAAGARFGDSLAARGSGTNTQLIMGGNTGTGTGSITFNSYAVFTTNDGLTFSGDGKVITGPASGSHRLGVDFGPGNTAYGKQTGTGNLEYSTFALGSATRNTGAPFSLTSAGEGPIGVDVANTVLATVDINNSRVRLYDITDPTVNPVLLDTGLFTSTNANVNGTGAIDFGVRSGVLRLYVLNTNNGIQAFEVRVPEPAGLSLLAVSAAGLLRRRRV